MGYAQFGTDIAVAKLFEGAYIGTYWDIGAHHPIVMSNTYLLYKRGWRGVTVEPTREYFRLQQYHRPRDRQFRYAISHYDGEADFYVCTEASVSTLDPGEAQLRRGSGQGVEIEEVATRTVRSLAEELAYEATLGPDAFAWFGRVPDLLSIDVEGHEASVLAGCPFADGWRPKVVILEACRPCTDVPCHEDWEHLILPHGYALADVAGVNRIYTAGGNRDV